MGASGFRLQTKDRRAFLAASSIVDLEAPHIQEKLEEISSVSKSDEQQAKIAFEFVRDEVGHSFDLDSDVITIAASEVLVLPKHILSFVLILEKQTILVCLKTRYQK
jgi:hypothetical protein